MGARWHKRPANFSDIVSKRPAKVNPNEKIRNCLKCGKDFLSPSVHIRRCPVCKSREGKPTHDDNASGIGRKIDKGFKALGLKLDFIDSFSD